MAAVRIERPDRRGKEGWQGKKARVHHELTRATRQDKTRRGQMRRDGEKAGGRREAIGEEGPTRGQRDESTIRRGSGGRIKPPTARNEGEASGPDGLGKGAGSGAAVAETGWAGPLGSAGGFFGIFGWFWAGPPVSSPTVFCRYPRGKK